MLRTGAVLWKRYFPWSQSSPTAALITLCLKGHVTMAENRILTASIRSIWYRKAVRELCWGNWPFIFSLVSWSHAVGQQVGGRFTLEGVPAADWWWHDVTVPDAGVWTITTLFQFEYSISLCQLANVSMKNPNRRTTLTFLQHWNVSDEMKEGQTSDCRHMGVIPSTCRGREKVLSPLKWIVCKLWAEMGCCWVCWNGLLLLHDVEVCCSEYTDWRSHGTLLLHPLIH